MKRKFDQNTKAKILENAKKHKKINKIRYLFLIVFVYIFNVQLKNYSVVVKFLYSSVDYDQHSRHTVRF